MLIVLPQRKIPARDWSKSRHVTFSNTHHLPTAQPSGKITLILPSR